MWHLPEKAWINNQYACRPEHSEDLFYLEEVGARVRRSSLLKEKLFAIHASSRPGDEFRRRVVL
jgi:hypothetical protein